MNNSVAVYAPKGKTYSLINSLLCCVSVSTGTISINCAKFWKKVASSFKIELDNTIIRMSQMRDKKKEKRRIVQTRIDGKKTRSTGKYEKFNDAHSTQLDGYNEGMMYETGVAVVTVN